MKELANNRMTDENLHHMRRKEEKNRSSPNICRFSVFEDKEIYHATKLQQSH